MITEILSPLRPDLSAAQLAQFETYYAMLADWNTRVNLTAITEPEDVAKKHFLDSLAAAPYLRQGASVADVGTGAGFPGVPLLILRPDLNVTLIDSLQKRLVFLEAVLKELKLTAALVHARAEDAGQNPKYREQLFKDPHAVLGKQLGIAGAVVLAEKIGFAARPAGASLMQVWGVALLCGIGFTMSLFIAQLAFPARPDLIEEAKLGVIVGSTAAALAGYLVLRLAAARRA